MLLGQRLCLGAQPLGHRLLAHGVSDRGYDHTKLPFTHSFLAHAIQVIDCDQQRVCLAHPYTLSCGQFVMDCEPQCYPKSDQHRLCEPWGEQYWDHVPAFLHPKRDTQRQPDAITRAHDDCHAALHDTHCNPVPSGYCNRQIPQPHRKPFPISFCHCFWFIVVVDRVPDCVVLVCHLDTFPFVDLIHQQHSSANPDLLSHPESPLPLTHRDCVSVFHLQLHSQQFRSQSFHDCDRNDHAHSHPDHNLVDH
mmetsp:Transcript_33817/g.60590  ORF Transcript_33817/g.60590 Transcript_33817/m.60590 type:complete len:250 (-) Transcript_33817:3477-4226(-)